MSHRPWVTVVLALLLVVLAAAGFFMYHSLDSDLTRLRQQNARLETRVDELDQTKQSLDDRLSTARQRLAQRKSGADALETQLNDLRQAKAATDAELQVSRQQVDTLTSKLDSLSKQLETSEARLAYSQSALAAQQATGRELTDQLAGARRRLAMLDQKRQSLAQDLATARDQKTAADQQVAELETQLRQARDQLEKAEQALAERKAALKAISDKRQTAEQQYQQAREQLALQASQSQSDSKTIAELKARMARERAATDSLQSKLQALSHDKEQLVSRLEDGTTVIKLPEQIVFDSGSAEIGRSGRKTLRLLADALGSFPDHMISVQGHTDSRTISPALQVLYPTNWELSTARAASAVRVLKAAGISADRMQAVGFADTRPLVKETDAASRRQNRRIEVLLYPNKFRIKPYQATKQ